MKITISGTPGSGKSTIGKALAKEFNLQHFSTGDFMRSIADKRKVSLLELSKIAESDRSIDEDIDAYSSKLGKTKDDFVIDSRLGFHFIPDSLKVFVKCSPEIAAKRIFKDIVDKKRSVEMDLKSVNDVVAAINNRMKSERDRYQKYYHLDVDNLDNYDIVIDTTNLDQEASIQTAIDAVKKHLKKE